MYIKYVYKNLLHAILSVQLDVLWNTKLEDYFKCNFFYKFNHLRMKLVRAQLWEKFLYNKVKSKTNYVP